VNDFVFQLTGVTYAYPQAIVFEGLSLNVPQGRHVALVGANGSGKSTLLRLLDALLFPQHGEILAFGQLLSESRMQEEEVNFAFRRRVGLVFQNPDVQLFSPTVFDELAFGPLQLGWDKVRIRRRVEEVLAHFDIASLKDRPPHRLSGGEKKRVALASVLILEPEVLLLDEPTAALDPKSRSEVIQFLTGGRDKGRTVITATHDLDVVNAIADHVLVLHGGRLAAEGTPQEILRNHSLLHAAHLSHWHLEPHGTEHARDHLL
jgi:cobalt/nickel transport system ATP-binding protein